MRYQENYSLDTTEQFFSSGPSEISFMSLEGMNRLAILPEQEEIIADLWQCKVHSLKLL